MIQSGLGGYCNIVCTQPRRLAVWIFIILVFWKRYLFMRIRSDDHTMLYTVSLRGVPSILSHGYLSSNSGSITIWLVPFQLVLNIQFGVHNYNPYFSLVSHIQILLLWSKSSAFVFYFRAWSYEDQSYEIRLIWADITTG